MKHYILRLLTILGSLLVMACSNDDNGSSNLPEDPMESEMQLSNIELTTLGVDNTLVRIDDTLVWEPLEGTNLEYQLFLGTTATTMERIATTNETSYALEMDLELGTAYFWQVTAAIDSEVVGESEVASFSTEYIAPRILVENASFSPRRQANTTAFNGRLWHMGGANAENPSGLTEIWSSENGIDWEQEPITGLEFERIRDYIALEFNGRLWLSGQSQLYSSDNGINWTREADPPFVHFGNISMASFNGALWRFAGSNGTITGEPTTEDNIYSSMDGTDWTLRADPHGFFSESNISIVVLRDLLYCIEQTTIDGVSTTVLWTSDDGINWREQSRSNLDSFGSRRQMVVFQNSLFILAGSRLETYYRSSDGIVWEPATTREVNTQLFLKNFAELNDTLYAVGGGGVNAGEEGNTVWIFN
ncbi:MAG: hypothetical protein AAF039_14930 [Bacteroidota bacterium]